MTVEHTYTFDYNELKFNGNICDRWCMQKVGEFVESRGIGHERPFPLVLWFLLMTHFIGIVASNQEPIIDRNCTFA